MQSIATGARGLRQSVLRNLAGGIGRDSCCASPNSFPLAVFATPAKLNSTNIFQTRATPPSRQRLLALGGYPTLGQSMQLLETLPRFRSGIADYLQTQSCGNVKMQKFLEDPPSMNPRECDVGSLNHTGFRGILG